MNYRNKELLFVSNLQTELGNNILKGNKSIYNFNSKEFTENREITIIIDFFANSRYNYVDSEGNSTSFHKCDIEEDKLVRWVDFFRHRYRIGNIPFIDYPKRTTNVILDLLSGEGVKIPDGGGPGYFLTKNSVGQLVWERINDCLFSQTFVTGPSATNPAPYTFTLNSTPEKIFQIFINGQLLVNDSLYDHDGNKVTLLHPIELDSATVKIYGGCESLSFMENDPSLLSEEDNFIWFTGEGYVFTTSIPIDTVEHVFINGQRIRNLYDYTYTAGTSEITILDTSITLEDSDEIDFIYIPGQESAPVTGTSGTFDTTFEDTFA